MIDVEDLAMLTDEDREWLAFGHRMRKASPEKFADTLVRLAEICDSLEYLAEVDRHQAMRPRPKSSTSENAADLPARSKAVN